MSREILTSVSRVSTLPMAVVVKDRMVENWVIADIDALAGMPARFRVTDADRRAVTPNRADSANALAVLKKMALRKSYDKVADGRRVFDAAEPMRIAANSRSFRKFLATLNHPRYSIQSRTP